MSLSTLSSASSAQSRQLLPSITPNESGWVLPLRRIGRVVAVLFFVLHAYVNRHLINPDGIAYLEVADLYRQGEWAAAINAYWSPLYSWILAGVLAIVQPTPYWECATAHAVNVGLGLLALLAFEWLLTEFLTLRMLRRESCRERWCELLPDWLVVSLAYAVFLIVARRLITVSLLTPDLLVAAGLFAACALILRLHRVSPDQAFPWSAAALGVILGASYLAKAVMFPLGLVIVAVAYAGNPWRRRRELLLTGLCFLVTAGPWIATLSLDRGRFLFGDAGRLNYLWYVEGYPRPEQLACSPQPLSGIAPRLLGQPPVLSDFRDCGAGSYALWFDPSRFYDHVRPRFAPAAQVRASTQVAGYYVDLFGNKLALISLIVVSLLGYSFFARRGSAIPWLRHWATNLKLQIPILLPALAGLGLYLMVGHAEGRLVGPFVLLLVVGLLGSIELPHPREASIRPLGMVYLSLLALLLLGTLGHDAAKAASAAWNGEGSQAHPHWQIAETLRRAGLEPGDEVASIGFTYNAYWARLGGYRCICEIPQSSVATFWAGSQGERTHSLVTCRLAGARAVVAVSPSPRASEFMRIPGTDHAYRLLIDPDTRSSRLQP